MGHLVSPADGKPWTFLTNHARVLIQIARSPQIRVRDIAAGVGITERAAHAIVADLEEAGYITRSREGRRTHYTLHPGRPFRHPADSGPDVQSLIAVFVDRDR